ncbi:MAG: hypothetical protein IMX04_06355 [Candidatus Carbobacillus altaicus]|nr:hypothetical protein [Candidatus Carbobacillus altaicus]
MQLTGCHLISLAIGALWAGLLFRLYRKYACIKQWLVPNWIHERIPTGGGVVYILFIIPYMLHDVVFDMLSHGSFDFFKTRTLLIQGLISVGVLIGWYDDVYGDRQVKSIRGHLQALWKRGEVTSGIIKLLTLPLIGALIAFVHAGNVGHESEWGMVLNLVKGAFLAGVLTHVFNLLDLRPLRAVKGCLLLLTAALLVGLGSGSIGASVKGAQMTSISSIASMTSISSILSSPMTILSSPTTASTVTLASIMSETSFGVFLLVMSLFEARRKLIIGDAGALLMGLWLTYVALAWTPVFFQILLIVILLPVIVYAEKYSLSRLIEKHPCLRAFDTWGVR